MSLIKLTYIIAVMDLLESVNPKPRWLSGNQNLAAGTAKNTSRKVWGRANRGDLTRRLRPRANRGVPPTGVGFLERCSALGWLEWMNALGSWGVTREGNHVGSCARRSDELLRNGKGRSQARPGDLESQLPKPLPTVQYSSSSSKRHCIAKMSWPREKQHHSLGWRR